MTEVVWETEDRPLLDDDVSRAVAAALEHGGRGGEDLAVVFCDDAFLGDLHERHLGDPGATDVITFDLGDEGEGPVGELYVSVERARDRAARRGVAVQRELTLYVVHGALHLCGFDDHAEAERERMRGAEARIMELLGFAPDVLPHDD